MENAQNNDTAMEKLKINSFSSSLLSASILKKFKEEFEKNGMFKFTSELEGKLTKCLDDTFLENEFTEPPSLTVDIGNAKPLLEQPEETATLPPLVFQFDIPKNASVSMGMLIDGKPEVLKNNEGSQITPALAAFTDDTGFIYGSEASKLILAPKELGCNFQTNRPPQHPKVWQCNNLHKPLLANQQQYQHVNLKDFGIFNLSAQFFNAFLIRKLKICAESQFNGGLSLKAIMAVPMQTKCAQRLRLREAAKLAGFKDVYVTSAEGLAAYYWFCQKEPEMNHRNFSKDLVIIDLFDTAVLYKSSLEAGVDGKNILVVKAIILLDNFTSLAKEEDEFLQMLRKKLNIHQNRTVIPVIREKGNCSSTLYFGNKYRNKVRIVEDDESDQFKYFAAKGAALLSENPENIKCQIYNMLGTSIKSEPETDKEIISPETMLPAMLTFSIKHEHNREKYFIGQIGSGKWRDVETMGYLVIKGVEQGTKLEVTCELSWESIFKVVGVSVTDDANLAVSWNWINGDKLVVSHFGSNLYKEYKSLLLKVTSPSHVINEVEFAVLTEEVSTNADIGSSRIGTHKRKRRIIRPNDIIVSTGLKKIKLEGDWVDTVIKREGEIGLEEGVVKVEDMRKVVSG